MKLTILNPILRLKKYSGTYRPFLILFLILFTAASVSVSIIASSNSMTDNIIKEYAGLLKIDSVYGKVDSSMRMTKEEYLALSDEPHIEKVNFYKYVLNLQTLDENALPLKKTIFKGSETMKDWGTPGQPFFVYGYNPELKYLELDGMTLEKGRWFEEENEAVINKNALCVSMEYSGWNGLDIGDKIKLDNSGGISKEFTIVGVLAQDPADDEDTYKFELYTLLSDAEYFDAINTKKQVSYQKYHTDSNYTWQLGFIGYEALIYLDSPSNFIAVKNELAVKGLNAVSFFSDANSMLSLTTAMQQSCVIYIIITAFLVLCVTLISTHILLSSRKYEIAVLRSTGMSKISIIISYLLENLIFIWGITVVSLVLAAFISPALTKSTFEQIKSLVSPEMYGRITSESVLTLLLRSAGIVFAGTTAAVIISLLFTAVSIMRFSPLKIYNKRY